MTDSVLMFEHAQLGLVSFPLKQLKRLQLYDGVNVPIGVLKELCYFNVMFDG
jgi:hypothetical protein